MKMEEERRRTGGGHEADSGCSDENGRKWRRTVVTPFSLYNNKCIWGGAGEAEAARIRWGEGQGGTK